MVGTVTLGTSLNVSFKDLTPGATVRPFHTTHPRHSLLGRDNVKTSAGLCEHQACKGSLKIFITRTERLIYFYLHRSIDKKLRNSFYTDKMIAKVLGKQTLNVGTGP